MFKINKMTDYALVCISILSGKSDKYINAHQISMVSGLSLYSVQKILKTLASKSDYLITLRGSNGGYKLIKQASEISILEIIELLDGPIKLTSCVEGASDVCDCSDLCLLQGNWNRVNQTLKSTLRNFSVEDLINSHNYSDIREKKIEKTLS